MSAPSDMPAADDTLLSGPTRRAAPVTREQVFAAAWELTRDGHRPTIDRIRMRLGGGTPRGSPNTVNGFLNDWWRQLALRLTDRPGAALPALPERVAGALEALWNEALAAARDAWRSEWSDRETQILDRERGFERRERELTEREQSLDARGTGLEEALTLGREQLAAANRRAEMLETALQRRSEEIAALERRYEAAEEDTRRLRAEAQNERAELQRRHDAQETRWLRDIGEARKLAKEHAQALKRVTTEVGSAHRERDRLQRELSKAQGKLSASAARRERRPAPRKRTRPKIS